MRDAGIGIVHSGPFFVGVALHPVPVTVSGARHPVGHDLPLRSGRNVGISDGGQTGSILHLARHVRGEEKHGQAVSLEEEGVVRRQLGLVGGRQPVDGLILRRAGHVEGVAIGQARVKYLSLDCIHALEVDVAIVAGGVGDGGATARSSAREASSTGTGLHGTAAEGDHSNEDGGSCHEEQGLLHRSTTTFPVA